MSGLDDCPEAVALASDFTEWMKECRFQDAWIEDFAVCTLWQHANGRGKPGEWFFCEPGRDLRPELIFTLPRLDDEPTREYLKRCDKEYRQRRVDLLKLAQFRTGARKAQQQPAKWTALAFHGKTFAEIAQSEPILTKGRISVAVDESTVRKAVRAFQRRIGLTVAGTRSQAPVSVSP